MSVEIFTHLQCSHGEHPELEEPIVNRTDSKVILVQTKFEVDRHSQVLETSLFLAEFGAQRYEVQEVVGRVGSVGTGVALQCEEFLSLRAAALVHNATLLHQQQIVQEIVDLRLGLVNSAYYSALASDNILIHQLI